MKQNGLDGDIRVDNNSYYGKETIKMKASTACKYALAITYGVCMGKFLAGATKAFVGGLAEGLASDIKSKTK